MGPLSNAAVAMKKCPTCGEIYPPDAIFCPKDGSKLDVDGAPKEDSYLGQTIAGDVVIKDLAGPGASSSPACTA